MSHLNWNLIPDSQTCSWKVIRTLFAFLALILIFQMFCFLVLIFGLICCSKATLQMYTFMVFPPFFQLVSSLPIYLLTSLRVSRITLPSTLECLLWLLVVDCWECWAATCLPTLPPGAHLSWDLMLPLQLGFKCWGGSTCVGRTTKGGNAGKMPWMRSVCSGWEVWAPVSPVWIACKFGVEATSWILKFLSSSTIIAP